MADALISSVLKQLDLYIQNQVTPAISQEFHMLIQNLKLVEAVVTDAGKKQMKNKSIRIWLDDLKQIVYDADDLLDELITRDTADVVKSSWLVSKHVIQRYEITRKINCINKQLDHLITTKQTTDFGFKLHQNHYEPPRLLTSSVVNVSMIRGRDEAKEDIMSRMLGETSSQGGALRVIAIVGIGGLGKTTLAKFIFDDTRLGEMFETKIWVYVSQPFSLVEVAKAIVNEVERIDPDCVEWEEVRKRLCNFIKGKKFLLVLDNVWTEDPSHWRQLKLALDSGAPGSRIILTTRNRSVAKKMGVVDFDIHELENLSDDDSWSLLRDFAFVGREKELEEFEEMRKEIAIKCKGVPLAITTLGGVLCERGTKQEWKDVLGSDLWEMPRIEQFFLPSVFLSYYSLPSTSKQCFLYCAIFPKDKRLDKDYLIRLWMAQGFFGFVERRDLERIGEDHFRILAMRSFFQDFEKDSDWNITSCKMHDLVHDFAIYLSHNECYRLEAGGMMTDSEKTRHLSGEDLEITSILEAKKLRTMLLNAKTSISFEFLGKLTCLRTLVLRDRSIQVLPDEVENLVHLRYLELSDTWLLELPETICNLYNLQFLGLNWCRNLHKLPEKIGKLINLRHLEIEGTDGLSYFPKSLAKLSLLRSLCKFIVSEEGYGCKIGDLQLLNNLRGALKLEGLSRVTDENDIARAELKKKVNLQKLIFCFREESGVRIGMKNVLEKLEPREHLEILEISDYSDSNFPGWVQSCSFLTNVVEISLTRCNQCRELPAFGKLGFLKILVIDGMSSVTQINNGFYGLRAHMTAFPKLEFLHVEGMVKLEEWELPISNDTKIMPLLSEIRLWDCHMLRALPCLGRLESLEILEVRNLWSVRYIGDEFYGFGADSSLGPIKMIAFPKLKRLQVIGFDILEEWEIPISKDRKIMLLVSDLYLSSCYKLRALPRVWRMESLEELRLGHLNSVKRVGAEFGDDYEGSLQDGVTFPKLKELFIEDMPELEEWSIPLIVPCLVKLHLEAFPKLKTLPRIQECMKTPESLNIATMWEGQEKIVINGKEGCSGWGYSCGLHEIDISNCPKLCVVPDYMFSVSLNVLTFCGDVGVLLDFFPAYGTLCSITQVSMYYLPHSALPNGFHQLKVLQTILFYCCETLDFDLKEELGHFTMLQHLEIYNCPILTKHFEGDDWRTIFAHVPKITINGFDH